MADSDLAIGAVSEIAMQLPLAVAELLGSELQSRVSLAASAVADGRGVEKVLSAIGVFNA